MNNSSSYVLIYAFFLLCQGLEAKTLEERIFDLEIGEASKNIVDLSGKFNTIYHLQDIEDSSSKVGQGSKEYVTSEFKLNIDKTNYHKLKFYSTIASRFSWNNALVGSQVVIDNVSSELKGSYPSIDKAYLDYHLYKNKFTLSLGRLPTINGPPLEKHLGSERMGTYPLFAYSVPFDGFALTTNLKNIFGIDKRLVFRMIYSPYHKTTNLFDFDTMGSERLANGVQVKSGKSVHLNLESSGKLEIFNYSLILHAYQVNFGGILPSREIRGLLQSEFEKIPGNSGVDRNTYEISSTDNESAKMDSFVAYFSFDKILSSGLDFYGSIQFSKFKRRGSLYYTIVEDNNNGTCPYCGALGGTGDSGEYGGFLYNDDQKATAYLLGTRYVFSSFLLGYEYLRKSFGSNPGILRTDSITDFYNTVGHGHHIYSNLAVQKNLLLTIGLQYTKKEAELVFVNYVKKSKRVRSIYSNLSYRF